MCDDRIVPVQPMGRPVPNLHRNNKPEMNELLKTGYCRLRQLRINRRERNYVYKIMRTNGIPDKPCAEEAAWLRKWRPLYASVSPVYLRCFRAYLPENRELIVPSEISANLIEPLLNPARYRFYYEDKNVYDRLFGPEAMPRTYLRRMEGQFYDAAYRPCDFPPPERLRELTQNAERIIVKPTVDTDSGRDIVLYRLDPADGRYKDQKGEPLTAEKTGGNAGGGNAIIQEFLSQHPFTAQFNPSSVNCFRMIVYRSPLDGRIEVLHTVLKVGGLDSYVDNVHAGGRMIGVGPDGRLNPCAYDQLGHRSVEVNGLDLGQPLTVPCFDELLRFARHTAELVPHCHLTALDIMLDATCRPRLIECNIKGFSYWIPQFCSGPAFGTATDEIIDYCRERLRKLRYTIEI